VSLHERIEALRRKPTEKDYAELRGEARGKLAGLVLLRDFFPCEETGLLVARGELVVALVEAAERCDVARVLSLKQAIGGLTRALEHAQAARMAPVEARAWQAQMRRTAQWN
jgi:hypothetical protein